jgi:hypothetical protein
MSWARLLGSCTLRAAAPRTAHTALSTGYTHVPTVALNGASRARAFVTKTAIGAPLRKKVCHERQRGADPDVTGASSPRGPPAPSLALLAGAAGPCARAWPGCAAPVVLTSLAGPTQVTTVDLQSFKESGKPITMVTAYSYPSALHVDAAGIDIILVRATARTAAAALATRRRARPHAGWRFAGNGGDGPRHHAARHVRPQRVLRIALATRVPWRSVDHMLYHCQAVARGADRSFMVGDMPFGSYEGQTLARGCSACAQREGCTGSADVAYTNAIRFLKEGQMDAGERGLHAISLLRQAPHPHSENGGRTEPFRDSSETHKRYYHISGRFGDVATLLRGAGGVAVMGHIGLTPQHISVLGGFRAQASCAIHLPPSPVRLTTRRRVVLSRQRCRSLRMPRRWRTRAASPSSSSVCQPRCVCVLSLFLLCRPCVMLPDRWPRRSPPPCASQP